MNEKPSNPNDPALRTLLREWAVSEPLPPRFTEGVWQRIERIEVPAGTGITLWTLLTDWINAKLSRPTLALAYVTLLLMVGGVAGWTQGRQEAAQTGDELSGRYVRVVDPYQATR